MAVELTGIQGVGHVQPREGESLAKGRFEFSDILQCYLICFGLFGQQAMVIAATGLGIDTRVFTVPARGLLSVVALTVLVYLILKSKRSVLNLSFLSFTLFWGAYGLRVALELSSRVDVVQEAGRFTGGYIATMAFGACFLPGLAILVNGSWRLRGLTRNLAILLTGGTGAAMIYFYGGHLLNFQNRMSSGQVVGEVTTIHPLALGYLGSVLCLFALYTFACRNASLLLRSCIGVALAAVGVFLLVGSASRGPVVALAVVYFVLLISKTRRLDFGRVFFLGMLFVVLAVGVVMLVRFTGSTVLDRLLYTGHLLSPGSGGATRLNLFQQALDRFVESPVIGSGFTLRSVEGTDMYPHNLILESLMATGLLGTVPLMILIFMGFAASWRILTRDPEMSWIPLLYVHFLTGSMFSGAIYSNVELWLALAATLSCDAWLRKKSAEEKESVEYEV
ncbi:O-antigen ligase family protein [Pelagicoccus mobilis]|uniref:O-antigen ligase family protein n=1 Tax=Pelagicoccus mobilis TaxID=415221 RepID=A0A934VRX5_9BACT|nr:O-antigen ligase family protein [Pelagicoccus mobilis]MBK1877939.1 O-antigen ligase family protein [Pelagicoccus mobilis]